MPSDRPDPSSYPFNYLVHDIAAPDGEPVEFATYQEVESYIAGRWGDLYVEHNWRADADWWSPLCGDNRFRIIWKSLAAGRRFTYDIEMIPDDDGDYESSVDAIRQRIARDAVAVIERERRAYEAALQEWSSRQASCPACGRGLAD